MKPKPDVSGLYPSRSAKAVPPSSAKGVKAMEREIRQIRADSIPKPTKRGSR